MRKRLFVAITPPQDKNVAITKIINAIKYQNHDVKWENPLNAHITLAFLGSTPRDLIPKISSALAKTAAKFPKIEIGIGGLGYFYNKREDSIIFLDVIDKEKILREVNKDLSRNLSEEDFLISSKFTPHITIGRLKKRRYPHERKRILAEICEREIDPDLIGIERIGNFTIQNIDLYESVKGEDEESRYRVLRSFPLKTV